MEERQGQENLQQDGPYIAGGFAFFAKEDAGQAEEELKKIKYLEEKMDYSQPEVILRVYEKAIRERVFSTSAGLVFLKKIQDYLKQSPQLAGREIPAIPPYMTSMSKQREKTSPARKRVKPSVSKEKQSAVLPCSIILNILLAIAIMAMFVITLNADEPNVLNYERALQDKYASWEQQLTEREQAVRARELELSMSEE